MHYYKKISIGTTTMRPVFLIVHSFWQSFQKRNSHNFKKLRFVPYFENLTKIYESKEKNWSQSGAYAAADASSVGPCQYVSVIFAGFFDWIFWHSIPGITDYIGTILVIIGGVLVILLSKKTSQSVH